MELAVLYEDFVYRGDPESNENVAKRLRVTRLALGLLEPNGRLTQSELCRRADINLNQWNHAETGDHRLSLNAARQLWRTFRISLDWIYLGMKDGLRNDLVQKINQIERRDP